MDSRLIEAENGGNWGKFMVGQWTHADLEQRSLVAVGEPLLGRTEGNLRKGQIDPRRARLVFDLQTKKGGLFEPDPAGDSNADLEASGLWVCPLFAPFLAWLYERGQAPVASLPSIFNLPPAQSKLQGYKRPGPDFAPITGIRQKLFDALKRTPPSDQPASVAQLMGFFDGHLAGPEFLLLQVFRQSLSERDWNNWLGSLLTDSGSWVVSAPRR